MSLSLTKVQQVLFDAEVKAAYQSQGHLLKDCFRMRRNVIGSSVEFRKIEQVVSMETGYSQSATLQDPNYSKEVCILKKYTTPTGVDDVQELTVNFDARAENAMLVGMAMGRRADQIGLNAVKVAKTSADITVGGAMDYNTFARIMAFFDKRAVPASERFILMSAEQLESLMKEEKFTNRFYTSNDAIDRGSVRRYLNFTIIVLPYMIEGGLDGQSGTGSVTQTMYAVHKMSLGMGIGKNFTTKVNYLPREDTHLINGIFSAGAVVIDDRGVLRIDTTETVLANA